MPKRDVATTRPSPRTPLPSLGPALGLVLVLAAGCNLDNPGRTPPRDELHFPIALTLFETTGGDPLLAVANQNLDAAYNTGTLQTWDIVALDAMLADCAPADRPGDCPRAIDSVLPGLLVDSVRIPTFASDLVLDRSGTRFYLAIEGLNGDLAHVDVEPTDGTLDCGNADDGRCAATFRRADEGLKDDRDLSFQDDLVAIETGPPGILGLGADEGSFIFSGHASGEASFYLDGVSDIPDVIPGTRPSLVDYLEDNVSGGIVETAFDPASGQFWIASGNDFVATVARVGVAFDPDSDEAPRLFDAGPLILDGVTGGTDVRDIVFEDDPGSVVLLSRTPEALLFATRSTVDARVLEVQAVTPICAGPSKLDRAVVAGRPQLFVSCFDARRIDVVDVGTRALITSIREAGGAFDLVVDAARERLYVTDFDNSTVRVAGLGPLVTCLEGGEDGPECSPRILGSLGLPTRNDEL